MQIINGVSHLDHGLTPAHLEWLKERYSDKSEFFIETSLIPDDLPSLECGLYGPIVGDEPVQEGAVYYAVRNGRKCASRIMAGVRREWVRPSRLITVVAGPHEGHPCVLYTSYGGPQAPREPGDLSLGTMEQILESRAFWAEHALAPT